MMDFACGEALVEPAIKVYNHLQEWKQLQVTIGVGGNIAKTRDCSSIVWVGHFLAWCPVKGQAHQ